MRHCNNNLKPFCTVFILITALLFVPLTYAAPLPNPLTLKGALSYATKAHPDVSLAEAQLATALSKKQATETINNVDIYLDLVPQYVMPTNENAFVNDSYIRLAMSMTLYDFGYKKSLTDSADESVKMQQLLTANARNQRYLEIMQRYLNVILADLQFSAINEKMVTLYVKYDKLLERHGLEMVSEVTLLEAETAYLEVADHRIVSERNQFSSRQNLAIVLNKPNDIPADLIRPNLPQLKREVPDLETLLKKALENNQNISALRHAITSTKKTLEATNHQYGPTLNAGLEFNKYQRESIARNEVKAGLTLHVPLLNGRKSQASKALATAKLTTAQAHYDKAVHTLRQQLFDLINTLEILKFKRKSDQKRLDSRALILEDQRARYELEMQTSLGNAMAKYTEAEWISAKNDFQMAITWTQVDILTGKQLYQNKDKKNANN